MQFMRDWILKTANEAQLFGKVKEHLKGITIDMLGDRSEREVIAQLYLPFHHDDGFIFLKKTTSEHDTLFPRVVEIDWYHVGVSVQNGKIVLHTYSQPKSDEEINKVPFFKITIGKNGCDGCGNWKPSIDLNSVDLNEIEDLIPSKEKPQPPKCVFISGSLQTPKSIWDRGLISAAIATKFPIFLPVSLELKGNFQPGASLRNISSCDLFILFIADYLTPWVINEFQWARQLGKPSLVLVCEDALKSPETMKMLSNIDVRFYIKYNTVNISKCIIDWLQDNISSSAISVDEEYKKKNEEIVPEIINIESKTRDWIRIALVQMDYSIKNQYPYDLKNIEQIKDRVEKVFTIASKKKVDLIVFPELSGSPEIQKLIDNHINSKNIGIVFEGSFFKDGINLSKLTIGLEHFLIVKNHFSKFEDSPIPRNNNSIHTSLRVFNTMWGSLSALICDDFRHESNKLAPLSDIIIVQSLNPKPDKFSHRASVMVEDHHNYALIANSTQYGGTSIYGVIDRLYLDELTRGGLRDDRDPEGLVAKLSVGEEAILMSDLNVRRKSILVPTPLLNEYSNIREVQKILF